MADLGSVVGKLPVKWPKLLGPFQNFLSSFFDVFGMSFYTTFGTKKSDSILKMVFYTNVMPSSRRKQADVSGHGVSS